MDKYELYNQVARDTFQYQDSLHKDFGSKAINLVGFSGALIAAGALMLRLSGSSISPAAPAFWTFVLLGIFFLLTALFGMLTIWPRSWRNNPTLSELAAYLPKYPDQGLIDWVGDEYSRSVEDNRCRLNQMARTLQVTMLFLTLQVCTLAAFAYLSL